MSVAYKVESDPVAAAALAAHAATDASDAELAATAATLQLRSEKGQPGGYARFTDYIVLGGTADDTAEVQTALTAAAVNGGTVKGLPGATFKLSAPLVISSNVTLDMRGCTIKFASTSVRTNMLQSKAATPIATAADAATTAGSAVVTSATLAAQAVVGQNVGVVGAGPPGGDGGGAIWLYGRVLSIVGNNITLTSDNVNGIAAHTTLSGATAYLFNRDSNITIEGGIWDGGINWNVLGDRSAAGFNGHQLRLRRVDHLTIKDVIPTLSGFPDGGGWAYGINLGDCNDFTVKDIDCQGCSDGVHVDGPSRGGLIKNVGGYTHDDLVAISCVNFQGNDLEGDITGVEVENIHARGAFSAQKLFGGTGSNSVDRYLSVATRSVKGYTQQPPINVVDYAGKTTVDASWQDVEVKGPANTSPMIQLTATGMRKLTFRDLRWRDEWGVPTNGVIKTTRPIEHLVVEDFDLPIKGTTAQGIGIYIAAGGSGSYRLIEVEGVTQPDTGIFLHVIQVDTALTIDRISVGRVHRRGGVNGTGGRFNFLVYNNSGTTIKTIDVFRSSLDGTVDGVTGGLLYYGNAGTGATVLKVVGCYINTGGGGSWIVAKHPITVMLDDCDITANGAAVWANHANATPVRVLENNCRFGNSKALVTRSATQAVSVNSRTGTADLATLTPQDQDIVNNSNAGLASGTGLAIFKTGGTGNGWKNLYSGATY